jgi:hypothetical protein
MTVRLLASRLKMEEDPDMTLYHLESWGLVTSVLRSGKEGVRMWVNMQRKPLNAMLTTYLPSILLLLITFATTFFKPFFFEAALTVNLTNMLVMTTLFIGVMQSLPTTAYVKMIDVWLIGCQLVPFAEVVLLTAMEYFRDGDDIVEPLTEAMTQEDRLHQARPTSGQGTNMQGTTTINHHGAPRVVKLGHYGDWPPSMETGPEVRITSEEVPHQQNPLAILATEQGAPADQHRKEDGGHHRRKYLNMTKYFGEYFFQLAAYSKYNICRDQSSPQHCSGRFYLLCCHRHYVLF